MAWLSGMRVCILQNKLFTALHGVHRHARAQYSICASHKQLETFRDCCVRAQSSMICTFEPCRVSTYCDEVIIARPPKSFFVHKLGHLGHSRNHGRANVIIRVPQESPTKAWTPWTSALHLGWLVTGIIIRVPQKSPPRSLDTLDKCTPHGMAGC
jgi:hypothetical protein